MMRNDETELCEECCCLPCTCNDDWVKVLTKDPKFLSKMILYMAKDGAENRELVKQLQSRVEILSEAIASVLPYHDHLPEAVMDKVNKAVNWG